MATEKITTRMERRRAVRPEGVVLGGSGVGELKEDLNRWLVGRSVWNHEEWEGLLRDLRTKGYSDLIDTPKGQEVIGRYLENNRKCAAC